MGLMKIEFSHEMNTNFTLKKINSTSLNSTVVDVFITPVDYLEEVNIKRDVNLTWNVTSFENKYLEIQLNYSSPLSISVLDNYDNITFHVKNFSDFF